MKRAILLILATLLATASACSSAGKCKTTDLTKAGNDAPECRSPASANEEEALLKPVQPERFGRASPAANR